jgi:hypothetical protein
MAKRNVALSVLSATAVVFFFCLTLAAQSYIAHNGGSIAHRGVPASVTSFGFGGHPGFHGVPASVTSQGFGGQAFRGVPGSVMSSGFGANRFHHEPSEFRRHHHHHYGFYSPYYGGYYAYVPYAYPYYYGDYAAEDDYVDDPNYAGQQARDYDDRAALYDDYRSELNSRPQPAQPAPEPVTNQPNTVLIFKDGHQVEIANYAIVGSTLYDLSDGRSKKVQLADLDLPATVKENDDRGVEFQLPAAIKAN